MPQAVPPCTGSCKFFLWPNFGGPYILCPSREISVPPTKFFLPFGETKAWFPWPLVKVFKEKAPPWQKKCPGSRVKAFPTRKSPPRLKISQGWGGHQNAPSFAPRGPPPGICPRGTTLFKGRFLRFWTSPMTLFPARKTPTLQKLGFLLQAGGVTMGGFGTLSPNPELKGGHQVIIFCQCFPSTE